VKPIALFRATTGTRLAPGDREVDMAKTKKRDRARKPTAARVSRKMAGVRPLRGEPGVGRRYDPGFRPPTEGSPWQDEGEPEVNG
jgi:hypothetical protein